MADLANILNKLVNPGIAIPGAQRKAEEEAQRQMALQAAEKAKVMGAAAAAPVAAPVTAAAPVAAPFVPTGLSAQTIRGSESSVIPQPAVPPVARTSAAALPARALVATQPEVLRATEIASPFTDQFGNAPRPGSWDALWGAKWSAARTREQNQALAVASGAGSQALGAEAQALRAEQAPALAEAEQAAALARTREQTSAQREISAAEVGQRREAAEQTATQLKRQIMPVPTGQRIDTSTGIPVPVNTYAYFTQDESGKMKQISIDPIRGAASAAPPKAAIDLLKKNPGLAKEFEAKYGPGSAAAVTGK